MELWPWQQNELDTHGMTPKRAIFAAPRLGKTLLTVKTIKSWGLGRCLVACPLVVAPSWLAALTAEGFTVINAYSGTAKTRIKALETAQGVVVVNYDGLRLLIDDLIAWRPEGVIADESHVLASPSSGRARAFRRLAWRAKYVRLLTGTPAPNHLGNLWGQMVTLNKDEWGSYEKFAQRYLIRDSMFPSRVLGHRNTDELQARVLGYATIVRREDAFGPDTWQTVVRRIDLPAKARAHYKALVKDWNLSEPEGEVNAEHILKRMIRLQQLAAGFLPAENGALLGVHRAKVDAVQADLDEIVASGEKAVIFHRFRWETAEYVQAAIDAGAKVFHIDGDVPVEMRAQIVADFAAWQGSCVAVVQTQSGGVGISFAEATHALFPSRGFSFVDDEQARDRIYKPGARRCVTYYEADETIDSFIAKTLGQKRNVHEAITNADRRAIAFGYI
jgi:hypothetical protein